MTVSIERTLREAFRAYCDGDTPPGKGAMNLIKGRLRSELQLEMATKEIMLFHRSWVKGKAERRKKASRYRHKRNERSAATSAVSGGGLFNG